MDNAVALAAIGLVGVLVTPLFKLLNANTKALNELVKSNKEIADSHKAGNEEAKARNGHAATQATATAELVLQGNRLTKKVLERLEKTAVIAAQDRPILVQAPEAGKK